MTCKMISPAFLVTGAAILFSLLLGSAGTPSDARSVSLADWTVGDTWICAVSMRSTARSGEEAWRRPVYWEYRVSADTVMAGVRCFLITVEAQGGGPERADLYYRVSDRSLVRVVVDRSLRNAILREELAAETPSPWITRRAHLAYDWPLVDFSRGSLTRGLSAAAPTTQQRIVLRPSARRITTRDSSAARASAMAPPVAVALPCRQSISFTSLPPSLAAMDDRFTPAVSDRIVSSPVWRATLDDPSDGVSLYFASDLPWWFYREGATFKSWLVDFNKAEGSV